MRHKIFGKYCLILGAMTAGSLFAITGPMWMFSRPYGEAFLLSLPPMLVFALSWMVASWWAWDRPLKIFLAATLGSIPLRIAAGLLWARFALSILGVPATMFVVALMIHWGLFAIPEIAMLVEFSRKLEQPPRAKAVDQRRSGN